MFYNVAMLGNGAIFSRHLQAIKANLSDYRLIGIYDPLQDLCANYAQSLNVKQYQQESDVYLDSEVNLIVILSPSYLHFEQMKQAILNGKNVLVEKPATFKAEQILEIDDLAHLHGVKVFTVLQVRLNPAVKIIKKFIMDGHFGVMRGVSLVQRWQRPTSYFTGWRGKMQTGGGILGEFAIHYLDVVQYLLGSPEVVFARGYNTKFVHSDVLDTIYSTFDFGNFGGSFEVTISCEPKNIECGLFLMSDRGYIRLGGKSLDEIVQAEFLDPVTNLMLENITNEIRLREVATLASSGASPYHPELYRQLIINPNLFDIKETYAVIKLIANIYAFF